MAPVTDPNTLSNYHSLVTKNTTVNVALNFETKTVSGHVKLDLNPLADAVTEAVLDTSYLDIEKVLVDGKEATFTVKERKEPYGSALHIPLPESPKKDVPIAVTITYSTTDKCTALQWMTPEQTSNKKYPYMFSQCQAIHARSLYPCQDTPAVKSPFKISIRSSLPVVASGLSTGAHQFDNGTLAYTFQQDIPIPSYLFAIASGDLAAAAVGPRSTVYTGPEELLKCKTELEGDVEKFVEIAEKLIYTYPWTTYNVLILPPSFPYGGMENPNITFATPTIISGDKSNIDVIAHELAHSWSGNLVSNASWEHFWLNEGWTTYIERRIQAALHGPQYFDFSAIIGWKAFKESVELYGADHEFTKMVIDLTDKDPDDAFSSIPYEKGFNFLYYLDRLVGREKWDSFIPYYFKKFHQKSLTSFDFKDTLLEFFAPDKEASAALATVDWDEKFYAPGLPPKPDFDTTLVDVCYALADCWKNADATEFEPKPSDIAGWTSGQLVVFLEAITDFEQPLSPAAVEKMRETYRFLDSENAEILSRFLTVGLKAKDEKIYPVVEKALGLWGRMKFVRPLFRLLNECDRELAVETFKKNEDFYHPICR
ncbi:peptidase family M1-domain-containing protein [Sphaerosporella brunnea]|uniref:Leukotriene A(4) hydrolase n=1 Tax=Sphaerosporella brunnea TaxID=1250544 RepID=A0A5J5EVB6_9PEZI|nr:peptidase family M1-domain-containing protein [Sphaerosporella brunnea]